MFIRLPKKTDRAFTLAEYMIAMTVFSIASLALATLFIFSVRSFAAMANYASLNQENRQAMDKLTREIREAVCVQDYQDNPPTLTLLTGTGGTVTYTFNAAGKQLVRTTSDGFTEVLLTNCNLLDFHLYQRNPSNGNYGIYPAATNSWSTTVKAVELTWKTSKTLNPTTRINSENVQTARIVIRKQK